MIKTVGEARFMRIAKAAAHTRRDPCRPRADDTPLVKRVVMHWLVHPDLNMDQAAAAAAKDVVASRDWQGRSPITLASLRRKLREDSKQVSLEVVDQVRREAEARGLTRRPENLVVSRLLRAGRWWTSTNVALGSAHRFGNHVQRLGHFLRAFEHLIDLEAPITQYARLYAEVAELLDAESET